MSTINTLLGTVEILDAKMTKGGHGQYHIAVDIDFDGAKQTLKFQSNDSELWDKYTDGFKLLEIAELLIEQEIELYINTL
jgi:hypothetical protein